MAKIIHLDTFRSKSSIGGSVFSRQLPSAETKASKLISAAADLLLESSPGNLRVAWMLQDLRDLLDSAQPETLHDALGASQRKRDVLTNLS